MTRKWTLAGGWDPKVDGARRWYAVMAVLGLFLGTGLVAGEGDTFGFMGPEIFPVEDFIGPVRASDLDGDGRLDLVVVNNQRSRINLLFNRTGQPPEERAEARDPEDRDGNLPDLERPSRQP